MTECFADRKPPRTGENTTLYQDIKAQMAKVIIGQEELIDIIILTFLARGHILLEGVPGLAKSLSVETFANTIGGDFKRFQFTPDKMPGDITGTLIYNEQTKNFDFQRGPIFSNVFLADEINRASPKVQSALLQAMQEKVVDVDRTRHELPDPFMVLATQNPIEQIGTYPLAEAQVDRFMVKYDVRYPERAQEAQLVIRKNRDFESILANVEPVTNRDAICHVQQRIRDTVRVTATVMDYIVNICTATRPPETYAENQLESSIYQFIRLGASPRASESLLALSKAVAFCRGRDVVHFSDIDYCAPHVLRHRILLNSHAISNQVTTDMIVSEILKGVMPY